MSVIINDLEVVVPPSPPDEPPAVPDTSPEEPRVARISPADLEAVRERREQRQARLRAH